MLISLVYSKNMYIENIYVKFYIVPFNLYKFLLGLKINEFFMIIFLVFVKNNTSKNKWKLNILF